jgi:hypothetical protein
MPGEVDYLNGICDSWLRCDSLPHTPSGTAYQVTLPLQTSLGQALDVVFPDYSGETVANAWALRRWPGEFDDLVRRASATALLVNPDFVYPATTIEAMALPGDVAAAPPDPSVPAAPYEAEGSPTQVKLVDFLQIAALRKARKSSMPIAVIVTAWDLVENQGRNPEEWFQARLPLLHQYLTSNSLRCPFAVFGVSAQGGPLPASRDELIRRDPVAKARLVRGNGAVSQDVTEPISWLIQTCR